ncbi:MAG: glutamyl-tRNA reductase [Dehalococcoidia bacterium]|nr:glutamyl-tRNA reductase [Dehalococcoidia bacterium]
MIASMRTAAREPVHAIGRNGEPPIDRGFEHEVLIMAGISHQTASGTSLETVAVAGDEHGSVLRRLRQRFGNGVLLSTCNRTELYATTREPESAIPELREILHALGCRGEGVSDPDIDQQIYVFRGIEAVNHLFSVASGLDSVILGETQIAHQVARAIEMAVENDTASQAAIDIFDRAIRTTRRVRGETTLNRGRATTDSIAVDLLAEHRNGFDGASALVVGAGEMGRSVAHRLRRAGVSELKIVSRTYSRARTLATETESIAIPFDRLTDGLNSSDVWVTCTSSAGALIDAAAIRQAADHMQDRRIVVADLALPADLDKDAASEDVIDYIDLQDIGRAGARRRHALRAQANKAREIVDSEIAKAIMNAEARHSLPTVKALGKKAEAIRQSEVRKAIRMLGWSSGSNAESVVEAMSQSIVKKLIARPISSAREDENSANTVSKVFGMDGI